MLQTLKSKKIQALIVGVIVSLVSSYIPGMDEASLNSVTVIVVAYLLGQSAVDYGKAKS